MFITYNPEVQQLRVNEAYTLRADGKKVVTPPNAFNEALPSIAANAPSYNSLREMIITHTGLERNAVIHLDYRIHTVKGHLPALMGNEMLAEPEPVKDLVIRVRIPVSGQLFFRVFNADYQPEITMEKDFRVYTWKLSDVAAMSSEEAQQGTYEKYPRLIFSTADNPVAVYSFLTGQDAFKQGLSDNIIKAENEWLKDKTDKFEKALRLQEKVVNDLKLYNIPPRITLYQCRTAVQTWEENGGTSLEKAVLLTAMMKNAGIDARVAVITRSAFSDDKIATLAGIEDFAVKADFRGRGAWIFSVTGLNAVNMRLSLPGRSFIVLNPDGKTEKIESGLPEQRINVTGKFLVSSDPRLTGEVTLYFDGAAYPGAGMVRDKKRMKNSLSGNLIGNDTTLLKESIQNPENGFQKYTVQSDKPFRKDSNFFYFNLPAVTTGIDAWGIKTLSQRRETAYEIPAEAEESYSYTLALPATMACFSPARKVNISNKAGSFTWELKVDREKITLKRELKFSRRIFTVADYPDFKVLMDYWNNPWYRQLVLTNAN